MALNKSLIKNQLNSVDENIVEKFIGTGSSGLIAGILSRKGKRNNSLLHKKIHGDFLSAYQKHSFLQSKLYPYVATTLSKICKHSTLVCLTNKPLKITRSVLSSAGIERYFQLVIAGDVLSKKKPSPIGVFFCAEKLKCKHKNMVMIGDSEVDIKTAQAAGIKSVGVNYGYRNDVDLLKKGATAVVREFSEIPTLIRKILV